MPIKIEIKWGAMAMILNLILKGDEANYFLTSLSFY